LAQWRWFQHDEVERESRQLPRVPMKIIDLTVQRDIVCGGYE
jgi:hypothetical protein